METEGIEILKRLGSIITSLTQSPTRLTTNDLDATITTSYGFDSLGFMQFVCAVEKEFDIHFPDDAQYEDLNTVATLVDQVSKCLLEKTSLQGD